MIATPLIAAQVRVSALLASSTPDPSPSSSSAVATASPSPSNTSIADGAVNALNSLVNNVVDQTDSQTCASGDFSICGLTLRVTHNTWLAQLLEFILGIPLQVAFTVLLGWIALKLARRVIERLAERIASGRIGPGKIGLGSLTAKGDADDEPVRDKRRGRNGRNAARQVEPDATAPTDRTTSPTTGRPTTGSPTTGSPTTDDAAGIDPEETVVTSLPPLPGNGRRMARARTLAQLLRSMTTVVIVIVVGLMVMEEIGLEITPLLASLSVIGVALGLGAQGVVRDVLAGMFMILEDQYGVGDSVNVGQASGVVEAVGLRVTQLRDINGTVWYVRNGEILSVGNSSQGWSRAVLDVNVGFEEDIDRVEELLEQISGRLYAEPAYRSRIMEAPEVWGVESVTQDSVVVRMVVKTLPNQSAPIARELRRRIRVGFARAGVDMHSGTRTMIVNRDDEPPTGAPPGQPAPPSSAHSPTGTDTASQRHPEENELDG